MADAKTKVVPVEPTKEMIIAGNDAKDDCVDEDWDSGPYGEGHNSYTIISSDLPARVYRAMLAAAPQPAASDVPHDVPSESARRSAARFIDHYRRRLRFAFGDEERKYWQARVDESEAALATPAPSTSTEEALRAENARLRDVVVTLADWIEHAVDADLPVNDAQEAVIQNARTALSR